MTIFESIFLGIVQGITELFPISSLGHSIILTGILKWNLSENANSFLMFLVATHFATALVLFIFFWKDWKKIIFGLFNSNSKLGWLLILGTVPAGIIGILFQEKIKNLFVSPIYASFFLIINGFMLYFAEIFRKKAKSSENINNADERLAKSISWVQSIKVGLMQILSLIPGFSRTGSTITGGLMVGLSHEDAVRFSFLLATPIIGGAALLKLPELVKTGSPHEITIDFIGALFAALGAYISVKFLTKYFKTKKLTPFAVYCVAAGILSAAIIIFTH